MLDIGELAGTIESEKHCAEFRKFLRNLDKTASAAPEVKGWIMMSNYVNSIPMYSIKRYLFLKISPVSFSGRFERYLDFVLTLRQLYSLPQSATAAEKRSVLSSIHAKFFTCPAKERIAVTSQVSVFV